MRCKRWRYGSLKRDFLFRTPLNQVYNPRFRVISSRFKHSLNLLKLFCSRDAILFAKFYCKTEPKNDILC
ncbi:hypothetical protein FIM56_02010 [Helicobacter pylori]|nr:hypothetical protein FIM69_03510 [Helicobacter pylori]TPH75492.1 hypothetical protein FIM56_02010 [Helicobacter pylori]TPH97672.1 hypothetical protein FIM40_00740 [Helicobacter pylori]